VGFHRSYLSGIVHVPSTTLLVLACTRQLYKPQTRLQVFLKKGFAFIQAIRSNRYDILISKILLVNIKHHASDTENYQDKMGFMKLLFSPLKINNAMFLFFSLEIKP